MARKITNVQEAIAYYEEQCLKAGKVAEILGDNPTKDEVASAIKDIPNHIDNCPDCTAAKHLHTTDTDRIKQAITYLIQRGPSRAARWLPRSLPFDARV